ncbi:RluA family pseudouridine synthase [Campylobacter pinnipediorum]|uniref:RluA family pseudouridine synthase n=1 Tax=Campylobacter pinnipediorum TaxID=1965231 RepID=UPI00084D43E0|nr:RluA family pseudouridine synthase [Campylobacter pinnipediorum]
MVEFITKNEQRLDVCISNELQISRNQALNLIKDGLVKVNKKQTTKPSFKVYIDDNILVEFAKPKIKEDKFQADFDVPIIYEDDDLLVINKPPHIAVHGASSLKEASLVEWLNQNNFMLSNLNGDIRAGIVHRLDKGTSGALVVAKNNTAHTILSNQLLDKSMGRIYLALSDFALKQNCIIQRPIGRNNKNRLKKAIIQDGRDAKTAFLNLISSKNANLIAAKLFTGRTHQIRVHLESINRHILGDDLYGFKSEKDKISRVMLHAYMLYFIHPITKQRMEFKAPFYDDFEQIAFKNFSKELFYEKTETNFINDSFCDLDSWMCIK